MASVTKTFKVTAVGDGTVGKTCMLATYAHNAFPGDYVPTVFDNFQVRFRHNDVHMVLELHDTAGQEEYYRLRSLNYNKTNIFLICFSINNPTSLDNVFHKWHPEIRQLCPNTPILLVGTKMDIRNQAEAAIVDGSCNSVNEVKVIPKKDGLAAAKKIQAVTYVECSALTGENLDRVFHEVAEVCLNPPKRNDTGCCNIN